MRLAGAQVYQVGASFTQLRGFIDYRQSCRNLYAVDAISEQFVSFCREGHSILPELISTTIKQLPGDWLEKI
jgi:hypothetical protein